MSQSSSQYHYQFYTDGIVLAMKGLLNGIHGRAHINESRFQLLFQVFFPADSFRRFSQLDPYSIVANIQ